MSNNIYFNLGFRCLSILDVELSEPSGMLRTGQIETTDLTH